MADENKEYVVQITADTTKFVANVKDADRAAVELQKHFTDVASTMKGMVSEMKHISEEAATIGKNMVDSVEKGQRALSNLSKGAGRASVTHNLKEAETRSKNISKSMTDAGKKMSRVYSSASKMSGLGQKLSSAFSGLNIRSLFGNRNEVQIKKVEGQILRLDTRMAEVTKNTTDRLNKQIMDTTAKMNAFREKEEKRLTEKMASNEKARVAWLEREKKAIESNIKSMTQKMTSIETSETSKITSQLSSTRAKREKEIANERTMLEKQLGETNKKIASIETKDMANLTQKLLKVQKEIGKMAGPDVNSLKLKLQATEKEIADYTEKETANLQAKLAKNETLQQTKLGERYHTPEWKELESALIRIRTLSNSTSSSITELERKRGDLGLKITELQAEKYQAVQDGQNYDDSELLDTIRQYNQADADIHELIDQRREYNREMADLRDQQKALKEPPIGFDPANNPEYQALVHEHEVMTARLQAIQDGTAKDVQALVAKKNELQSQIAGLSDNPAYKAALNEQAALEKQLAGLKNSSLYQEYIKQREDIEKKLANLEKSPKYQNYAEEEARLQEQLASIKNNPVILELVQQKEEAEARLAALANSPVNQEYLETQKKLQEELDNLGNSDTMQNLIQKREELEKQLEDVANSPAIEGMKAQRENLMQQLGLLEKGGIGSYRRFGRGISRESKRLVTVLKNTLRHFKNFFSKILHLSNGRGTEKGIKRLANAFTRLWGMFKTRLKRRFISAAFEDARNDMLQLAKAFPSMNNSISGVVNSVKQFGAQVIAILQPIISAVGPLVVKVLDAATKAADKVAQFSAKLFGQNQYGKATKGNYDFVKSMDDTTKSVNNADDALSDYSSNLLGFDKLNQLQAVNNSTGATIKAEETEPVKDNAFNKWAEELKKNWDNKDWSGFGATLANGLNDAINWINNQDWDALSDKVTGFIANIQEAFNGFIKAFDAEGVGHLIGRVGNLLINAWKQLVKPVEEGGFDFHTFGAKIGTMLVTALQDIKWDEAGQALGNTGNRLAELFRGILEQKFTDEEGEHTLGYGIGKAISTFITNALHSINTDDWATLIADIVNNLLDMFIQIFSSGPELGEKIAEILNKSLKDIDAGKLGEAISGLSQTFNALIEKIDWGQVVSKLGDALSHVDIWSVLKSIFYIRIGKKIGNFFNNTLGNLFGGGGSGGLFGGGLLRGLLGKLLGTGGAGAGGAGGGGLLSGLWGKLGGFLSAHPLLKTVLGKAGGLAAAGAALWGGNQIGRALSQDKIEAYHEFKESGEVLDTSKWDTAQRVGGWLMATLDNITDFLNPFGGGVFDGFSQTYGEAMKAEEARKTEEYNAAKFGENMANGVSEAMTQAARDRNGAIVDSEIAYQILHDYQNNISRDKLENRWGMSVEDMNTRYGLNMEYDGQTAALTETIQNNTTAMQSVEASTNTSAEAMTKAADYMKSVFESLQKDTSDGQPVNLMIDGYKFGEFVLKQLGTLMHVKLAAT